jgi:acyl-CoA synthetase (AMP-forming)/AMP-acid ligase II
MAAQITHNIASHLSVMAEKQPWRAAVVFPHSRDRQGRVSYTHYTFRQLDKASDTLARGFDAIGLKRGMRTALMVPPSLDFFALTFALFKLGAIPVLIDPGIGLSSLGKGLANAEPQAFIGISKAHIARVLFGWARNTVKLKITVGPHAWTGGMTLEEIRKIGLARPALQDSPPEPDETAAILFTSGSTGPSKGVVYTHEYFSEQVRHLKEIYGIEPGEIDLPTFPLFALFGPALGMTAIIPDMNPTRPADVDPVKILEAVENFGVTNMFGSPALINRVGRYGETHGTRLTTLRRVISAGAPASAKVLSRFAALLPPGVEVFTPYGATECLPVASTGTGEFLGETRFKTATGGGVCVGQPINGVTAKIIRITDDPIPRWDDSLELPRGQIGEIAVKARHATRHYYNQPEATALAKIPEAHGTGFYHRMGDVGYLDERGRIWFCGRKAHRVVTPDATFFTIPCEGVFNAHPAVYRSALVGIQRNGVTEPVICVELEKNNPGDPAALRAELQTLAQKYPHTRAIKTILFHPSFPVDIRHNAKIFREKLAVWAQRHTP